MRKRILVGILVCLLVVGIAGAAVNGAKKPVVIKLALGPYINSLLWILPDIYKWDKDQGIDIQIVWFVDSMTCTEALIAGNVDISTEAISVVMPQLPKAPFVRQFSIIDEFRGNAIEIRKGQFKTFDEFYKELGNVKAAQKATMSQMIGKKLITTKAIFEANIECAMNEAGLTLGDVTTIDMEQAAGAAAFVAGTGDFYFGGLPQHVKLRSLEGGGKYIPMITSKYMGPGGLYITTTQTTQGFVDKYGEDMLVKLAALWFRAIKALDKYPDKIRPVLVAKINQQAGGGWTIQKLAESVTTDKNKDSLIYIPTIQDVGSELITDPDSPTYFWRHADWHFDNLVKRGQLTKDKFDIKKVFGQIESVYRKLTANAKLMKWVNQNERF